MIHIHIKKGNIKEETVKVSGTFYTSFGSDKLSGQKVVKYSKTIETDQKSQLYLDIRSYNIMIQLEANINNRTLQKV